MKFPGWIKVRQNLDGKRVDDPYGLVHDQLMAGAGRFPVKAGARIAITAGSRYIANLVPMTKAVIDYITSQGGCSVCRAGHGKSRRGNGPGAAAGP